VNKVPQLMEEKERETGEKIGTRALAREIDLSRPTVIEWRKGAKLNHYSDHALTVWKDYFGLSSVSEIIEFVDEGD